MTTAGIGLGLAFAVGILLLVDGFTARPRTTRPAPRSRSRRVPTLDARRVATAVVSAVVTLAVTKWLIAGLAGGVLVWFAPALLGGKPARDRALARTEAIAAWTEMLRDTISAAHGIEAAIAATAPVSPPPIRDEIRQLARRVQHEPLGGALAELADDLAHPIADLVVSALSAAAATSTRELAELLSTLAAAARDEASMHLRVEAARARMRTAVRVITAVTVATALGLIVLNPSYVAVYASVVGQVVLAGIFVTWGAALWWLARMSRFAAPDRFLLPRPAPEFTA